MITTMKWLWAMRWARKFLRRRDVLFSHRQKFFDALRPRFENEYPDERTTVVAYPDAIFMVKAADVDRAIEAAQPLTQEETNCPKCGGETEERPNSYHWRGQMFSGCYCESCNSLWEQGPGWAQFKRAVNTAPPTDTITEEYGG